MADDDNTTHREIEVSADQIERLADSIFYAGLESRRGDLLLCSALLRKLAINGDIERLFVWRLDNAEDR